MGTVKSPITDSSPSPSSFFFSPFQLIEDVARPISVTWHTGLEGLDRIPSSTMSVSGVYRTINQISAPSFQKSLWLTALITVQNMLRRSALRGAHARGFSSEARYWWHEKDLHFYSENICFLLCCIFLAHLCISRKIWSTGEQHSDGTLNKYRSFINLFIISNIDYKSSVTTKQLFLRLILFHCLDIHPSQPLLFQPASLVTLSQAHA